MKRFDLETSDIILLATEGFHTNFHHSQLAEDIAAPDAFTANIRLAQLHSRQADNSENGTILAIKVRDLELVEPDDAAKQNVERIQKSYGSQAPENGTSANVRCRRRNAKDKYQEFGQEPTSSQDVINIQRENNSNGRNGNDYMDTADQVRTVSYTHLDVYKRQEVRQTGRLTSTVRHDTDKKDSGRKLTDRKTAERDQKKPDKIIQKIDKKLIQLISSSIRDVEDENGWAFLAEVGNLIVKKQPSFDSRNYCLLYTSRYA